MHKETEQRTLIAVPEPEQFARWVRLSLSGLKIHVRPATHRGLHVCPTECRPTNIGSGTLKTGLNRSGENHSDHPCRQARIRAV